MCETVAKRQPDDIDIRVGGNLHRLRTEKGLSQFDLADALDVSVTQLQKYETWHNRMCAARLYRSAQALGVTLDDLFAGCGEQVRARSAQRSPVAAETPARA
jgi:transcriptional regulator with XRE-family HTH domain